MTSLEPGAVVFLHGAGLDPRLFDTVMHRMPTPTIAPTRAAYASPASASRPARSSVEAEAAYALAHLDEWAVSAGSDAGPVAVVGVSGGATIGLAMAAALGAGTAASRPVAAVVVHEPLVGSLARELHTLVADAARRLADDPTTDGVDTFLTGLVGEATWSALPADAREFARRHHRTVRAEVESFIAFEPTERELGAIRSGTTDTVLTVTVGATSGPHRHHAAEVVASLTGAEQAIVPDAAHLVQVENPIGFERIVTSALTRKKVGR